MKYQKGTASVTNGSQVVTGTGTKWLKKVKTGHLFTTGAGVHYQVGAIVSDTELRLSVDYGESTQSDIAYSILSDFTEYFSLPYPTDRDAAKASIIDREMRTLDRLTDRLSDRIQAIEYPGLVMVDAISTPVIDPVLILVSGSLFAEDMESTPSIDTTFIQQQLPGGLLVDSPLLTPVIDTVVIQVAGSIYLTMADITVDPSIDPISLVELVTADSIETADSDTILADGSGGPEVPIEFFALDLLATPAIDTVAINQQAGLTMVPADATATPQIDTVDLSGGIVTADNSTITADATNPTADGLLAA